jgi:predicted dehydrogenase
MDKLKIAFVGMGSIGKRHLANVRTILDRQNRLYSIDLYRSGRGKTTDNELIGSVDKIYQFDLSNPVSDYYDAVFITNPTSMHYETIRYFAASTRSMFIEKPLFDTTDVNIDELEINPDTVCYVAAPLRYHPVIDYVRNNVPCERAICVRAICSSYLPDWRPGTDYRQCYSAHREMGGGVGIDLIHEWDYLSWLFGEVLNEFSLCDKISDLEIDSDDIAVYIAKTEHTVIELHLDYFGRSSIRQLQIFLPDDTVECDILNGTVKYSASGKELKFDCRRDTYQQNEIEHFLKILDGKIKSDNDINHALRVLKYAKGEI